MPRKKGQVYPSDEVYNERRRAKRLRERLAREQSATKREAASRQSLIEALGAAIESSYIRMGDAAARSKAVASLQSVTARFRDRSVQERRNLLFSREINRASKGGIQSSIHRNPETAQAYAKIFWQATRRMWEGKADKYAAILEATGEVSLEAAFNKIVNANRAAVREYRRESKAVEATEEAEFFYGDADIDVQGSPDYLAYVKPYGR